MTALQELELLTPECSTMPRPDRIHDLDDVKAWIADHDGRIDAWWDQQHSWNVRTDRTHELLVRRISTIEGRIYWASGVFAGAGALLGSAVVPWLMK